MSRLDIWVQCAPGLETLVVDELAEVGITKTQPGKGGVAFVGTARQAYLATATSRCATRVVHRVARFNARDFKTLQSEVRKVDWDQWIAPGESAEFRVTSRSSKLFHTDAIAERLIDTVDAKGPGRVQLFVVRADHDRFTISVDLCGDAMHKRGWRQQIAKAPLRETLAAAMVRASGWTGEVPLIDPFCGSGTIAIEAALIATKRAPGLDRGYAFQEWPDFEPGTWASVNGQMHEQIRPIEVPIIASDRDAGAVAATKANAERAELSWCIEAEERSVSDLVAPAGSKALLLANPPYGKRVGDDDLRNLYARLGTVAKEQLAGGRIGLLVADAQLANQVGLRKPRTGFSAKNGGIDVRLLLANL